MGFLAWLGLSFIILKVLNFITWSWWIVLLPIYGGYLLAILIIILLKVFK